MKQDLLIFTLGTRERFAVNVANTKEIITLGHLNQMPGASSWVHGVTRVREKVIPVVDTYGVLFGKTREQTPVMAIVLDLEHPIALAVFDVSHVHKFDPQIQAHEAGKGNYVEMIIQDEHGLIQKLREANLFAGISRAHHQLQAAA
ncbi:chemotaxis protein CheW [Pseudomonas fluorescens]|uniref:chemotaxis protein CheW n=1 Tax=Pseudomonas TaxID=286 RepID=UPI000F03CAC1|nr:MULTISPECIES: chemotaxis protein CheW [Pseudomonas]MBD8088561.1 chemotaxis protein CheW [Pseudomonas fluorescens]MBD8614978.1 chemotaxis protein CheW [Pseudomonas putida]MBD8681339.1 chemotaxis protein CheW [Pseudomonas sp. CFBP 13719]